MKRVVDWLSLLFVSVGAMIGSGWMMGPFYAVKIAGAASVFAWVLGGVIVMIIALVFAELSAMLPVTGGIARYPQFSHGGFVSFVMTWMAWVAYILLPPVEVQALLEYSANFYPQLVTIAADGSQGLSGYGIIAAVFLLCLMSYINILGIKFATELNKYLVYLKLTVPFLVALVLMQTEFHYENLVQISDYSLTENLKNLFKALPLAGVIFSFFGFRHSVEIGGEAENPQVTLPLALIGSILLCMVLYTLVQLAFIVSMPVELVQNGWENFSFSKYSVAQGSDTGPFVALATILGLVVLVKFIFINAIIAPFGSALMVVTTNARLDYAMSINGYFPKFLTKLNSNGAPFWALIVNLVLGLFLLLPFPGWQQMVSLIIAGLVVSHAIAPICLYTLRKQVPHQKRPFVLPWHGFFCRLVFILLNLIAYWTGWDILSKMFLAVIAGLIYLYSYRFFFNKNNMPFMNFAKSTWLWGYLIGLALISYSGDTAFKGIGFLSFGYDMAIICLFSIVVFEWAVKEALTPEQTKQQIMSEHEVGDIYYADSQKSKDNNTKVSISDF